MSDPGHAGGCTGKDILKVIGARAVRPDISAETSVSPLLLSALADDVFGFVVAGALPELLCEVLQQRRLLSRWGVGPSQVPGPRFPGDADHVWHPRPPASAGGP